MNKLSKRFAKVIVLAFTFGSPCFNSSLAMNQLEVTNACGNADRRQLSKNMVLGFFDKFFFGSKGTVLQDFFDFYSHIINVHSMLSETYLTNYKAKYGSVSKYGFEVLLNTLLTEVLKYGYNCEAYMYQEGPECRLGIMNLNSENSENSENKPKKSLKSFLYPFISFFKNKKLDSENKPKPKSVFASLSRTSKGEGVDEYDFYLFDGNDAARFKFFVDTDFDRKLVPLKLDLKRSSDDEIIDIHAEQSDIMNSLKEAGLKYNS